VEVCLVRFVDILLWRRPNVSMQHSLTKSNINLVFVSRDFEVGSNDSCDSRKKKFSSDLNEVWYVGKWVMHDGMQLDPIQGQGHEPLKVGNSAIFDGCLFPHL